ncbi:hypothetical protein LguiA_013421 [Lonicera macranthoides]
MEVEEEEGRNASRGGGGGSLRTRSQVAPDWRIHESLILVNELCAVEGDCLNTVLSSFQKWKIVVENCNALDVNRALNQCRRHWASLLSDYNKIKLYNSSNNNKSGYWVMDVHRRRQLRLPENFDPDLYKAVDDYDKAREGRCDTDPDTDPDAGADAEAEADLLINLIAESETTAFIDDNHKKQALECKYKAKRKDDGPAVTLRPENSFQKTLTEVRNKASGKRTERKMSCGARGVKGTQWVFLLSNPNRSKKQRRRGITPHKRSRKEKEKPKRGIKCEKAIKAERCSSSEVKLDFHLRSTQRVVVDEMTEETNTNNNSKLSPEDKEHILSQRLLENAEMIDATLKGEDIDYKVADLRNIEAIQTDIARRQADDLVVYLGNIADTLDQLCKLVQEGS